MNSLIIVLGSVLLSGPALANEQESTSLAQHEILLPGTLQNQPWALKDQALGRDPQEGISPAGETVPTWASMDDIVFLEAEGEIDLGFDTSEYLPEGFDPHKIHVDLNAFAYQESEQIVVLGFDTKVFLPENFNPYTDVVGLSGINYMEEEEISLGFDTADYLPQGFSPYKAYWDLDSIPEMDQELPVDLGLFTGYGLPEDFDPYTNVVAVGSISFMEPEDMELGYDILRYLPKDFDPYAGSKQ